MELTTLIVCPRGIDWGRKLWGISNNRRIALNAHSALKLVAGDSRQFGLVIMSSKPPGMSAWELIDELRNNHGITSFKVVIGSESERAGLIARGVNADCIITAEKAIASYTSDD